MSTARICKECGKKFYPKSYYSYPQFGWRTPDADKLEYARFHSQGCMHDFINRNREAFSIFVDNIYENVIQEDQTINQ